MESAYWTRLARKRIARRRALASVAGLSAAGLLLAACGDDDDEPASSPTQATGQSGSTPPVSPTAATSLVTEAVDTTANAQMGGTMKFYMRADIPHFDGATPSAPLNAVYPLVYNSLLGEKPGIRTSTDMEPMAELAESWEWSPDMLRLTLKLRQGVKFHDRPPVSGREMTSEDVVASWNRFAEKSLGRNELVNAANPAAPVLSLTATDPYTVVFDLKEPYAYLLYHLAFTLTGSMGIYPREVDEGFDPRREMIGTGPYSIDEYVPSVGITLASNPDYFDPVFKSFDAIEMPILTEYAQGLAQLKAGNIYTFAVAPEDIVATKKDVNDLNIYELTTRVVNVHKTSFGWKSDSRSPFLDPRVRLAYSMSLDRDLFIDTFFNVPAFEADGLPVRRYWNTVIGAVDGWWLDPSDASTFGENAKYFAYDIEEAKKLLSAAGFEDGLDTQFTIVSGNELGASVRNMVEVQIGMVAESGFRVSQNLVDYATDYIPNYRDSMGNFVGMSYKGGSPPSFEPSHVIGWEYATSGSGFLGFDAGGLGDNSGDPKVDDLYAKARSELDVEARKAIVAELQRYLAAQMYSVHLPGIATGFTLAWPAVGNFGVKQYASNRRDVAGWWLDTTKPPLA